jgi:hypothetical protein
MVFTLALSKSRIYANKKETKYNGFLDKTSLIEAKRYDIRGEIGPCVLKLSVSKQIQQG